MTAADPFTQADALFRNALRQGMKDGAPLTWMPSRKIKAHFWAILCGSLVAVIFALVTK